MNKLLFLLLALVPLLLVLPLTHTQTTTAQTSGNNLTKLFGNTTNNFTSQTDNIQKSLDSAVLHNNTTAFNLLKAQDEVLGCIDSVFLFGDVMIHSESVSSCDYTVTYNIVHHSLGNNATLLHLAHQYLLARGIK